MKLELYKAYADRLGRKCVVVDYRVGLFTVWHSKDEQTRFHGIYGSFCYSEDSCFDLIEEWKEPKVFEGEVLVLKGLGHVEVLAILKSETKYFDFNSSQILARHKFSFKEGDGL